MLGENNAKTSWFSITLWEPVSSRPSFLYLLNSLLLVCPHVSRATRTRLWFTLVSGQNRFNPLLIEPEILYTPHSLASAGILPAMPLRGTFFCKIHLKIHADLQRGPYRPACVPGTHCPVAPCYPCPRIYHCLNSHMYLFYLLTVFQNTMDIPWEQELSCSYWPLWPWLLDLCPDHSNLKKSLLSECQIPFSFLSRECLWGHDAQVAGCVCKDKTYDKFLKEYRKVLFHFCFMQYQPYFFG